MNNTALRAELLSASGTCSATTGAERRPQSVTNHKESVICGGYPYDTTHMVFANEKDKIFYYEKLEQARYHDCFYKALLCNVCLRECENTLPEILQETQAYGRNPCRNGGESA